MGAEPKRGNGRILAAAMERRAKIVATIGPASRARSVLRRLLTAGADVVRLNLSHGDSEQHRQTVAKVREISRELGKHVAIILDLMGPRYRLGVMSEARSLRKGERVRIGPPGKNVDLPIDDPHLISHIRTGERVLIADGLIELKVEAKRGGRVTAKVVNAGKVSSRKGINLPDTDLPFTISDKDRLDVALAVELDADYLAASYVGTARDLNAIRRVADDLDSAKPPIPLIAKLERARAIRHLHEIVSNADAVMVARGDLGVEVPLYRVPVLQKQIIESGRAHGKPVIVATQMLESMVNQPRPTRAESSDVANAVFDGADALMLSGETAAGRYPVEAVKTMARIIREAEDHSGPARRRETDVRPLAHPKGTKLVDRAKRPADRAAEIADVVSAAAVFSTRNLKVKQIVAFSQGGFTALMIARYRPGTPICVLTPDHAVARRIQLVWGTRPVLLETNRRITDPDEVIEVVDHAVLAGRLARKGDILVVLMGAPIAEKPLTNLMRIHRVRDVGEAD